MTSNHTCQSSQNHPRPLLKSLQETQTNLGKSEKPRHKKEKKQDIIFLPPHPGYDTFDKCFPRQSQESHTRFCHNLRHKPAKKQKVRPTHISQVAWNRSWPPQWCGARRRWQSTISEGLFNGTDIVPVVTPPRRTVEVTSNQVHVFLAVGPLEETRSRHRKSIWRPGNTPTKSGEESSSLGCRHQTLPVEESRPHEDTNLQEGLTLGRIWWNHGRS